MAQLTSRARQSPRSQAAVAAAPHNELKTRGVRDILIACCDGLKGFPEAIEAAFPQTVVQTCIVHMIRNSVGFVSFKDRKEGG